MSSKWQFPSVLLLTLSGVLEVQCTVYSVQCTVYSVHTVPAYGGITSWVHWAVLSYLLVLLCVYMCACVLCVCVLVCAVCACVYVRTCTCTPPPSVLTCDPLSTQVQGSGTPNPYRLYPLTGSKIPVNGTYAPIITMYNPHPTPLQVCMCTCVRVYVVCNRMHVIHTVEPPNEGHFGDNINSANLFFVERFSTLGGSECIVGVILGL